MFNIFVSVYVTMLGLILGSFYNVVALRIPVGKSIVSPPSRCPKCGTRLKGRDLVPVLSWILSSGKCRYCQAPVSGLYALGEGVTGLLFLWVYLRTGLSGESLVGWVLVSLCVIVSVSDLKYMLIPNKVLLFFLPVLVLLRIIYTEESIWNGVLGAVVGGGIVLLLALAGGMGMGDAKLFVLCGWVIGFPNVILAFLLSSAIGTLVYGMLMLLGFIKRKQPVPFGPWLAIGTIIAYGYGSEIIGGYLSLIR
ncbi:prepilin peptidase [Paenibacillus glacialis]|uniref:Prepilin peptidase n=1 Tax=Paenibacillus glacialis TaxID=494026 RepID=A0A168L708_9BACL|nr:A24 family peptidase [Paenibacillus glacialis]OAB42964.1 prepilin peptidase [Paenibacillus glacialis]